MRTYGNARLDPDLPAANNLAAAIAAAARGRAEA